MMNQWRAVLHTIFRYTAACVIFWGLAGSTAKAVTNTWINGSGDFNTGANWDTATAPANGDDTVFTNNTTYTVSFPSAPATIDNSTFNGQTGRVTLDISAQTWAVTNSFRVGRNSGTTATVVQVSGTLSAPSVFVVGDAGVGNYFLSGGALTAQGIWIGNSGAGVGSLTISGSGTLAMGSSGTLSVGRVSGTSGNSLIISNSVSINTGTLTLGGNTNAFNNSIQVLPGAYWFKWALPLLIGGTSNRMVVNGGTIDECGTINVGAGGTALGSLNTLILTNGAYLLSGYGNPRIGTGDGAYGNTFIINSGSVWAPGSDLGKQIILGAAGFSSNNTLLVTGGGIITNTPNGCSLRIGDASVLKGGNFNSVVITDGGKATFTSVDLNNNFNSTGNVLQVGGSGALASVNMGTITTGSGSNSFNSQIVVTNATFVTGSLRVGNIPYSSSNTVSVLAGALWNFTGFDLQIGRGGSSSNLMTVAGGSITNARAVTIGLGNGAITGAVANTLNILNGGQVNCGGNLTVGNTTNDNLNVLAVGAGGTLTIATNLVVGGNAVALSNSLVITGGKVLATSVRVRATNTLSFTAGTLNTGGTTIDTGANNGVPVIVGDGVSAASLELAAGGTGFHNFNDGLVITNAATLRGVGTVMGNVTVLGTLVPGFSPGTIVISNNLVLSSASVLQYELGTSSDLTTVAGALTLDGTINVTDAGGFATGNYTIFNYGSVVDNTLNVGTLPGGFSGTVSNDTANSQILLVVTAAVSDPFVTWQTHYFPGGGPSAAGAADPDGDGMNNTNEFLAGFNPTNSAAYVHVTAISRAATNITVTYLGASGDSTWSPGVASRTNVLEFTTGAPNGSYSNNFASTGQTNILSGGTGLGTIASFVVTNGASGSTRYYRVRVLVP